MSEGFQIGPWLMRWNGFLLVLGIAAGALLIAYQARRREYDPEIIYYLFLPMVIWGTIGARLWHIFTPPLSSVQLGLTTKYYLTHPLDALALWTGGFGIPGAIIGCGLVLFLFSRRNEIPFWNLADLFAPGLALAQVIGRIGNYFNQELYGLPTEIPWAIFVDPANRLRGYENVSFYHPLFAYESAFSLVNLFLLLWLARKFSERLKAGDLFLVYLLVYSVIRFSLEFLRLDVALVNGWNVNQLFFGILFICTGGVLLWRRFAQEL
ncbi:MAG: prolipoprotein diacylglyceryl transferase [Anaerolineales bacterium]